MTTKPQGVEKAANLAFLMVQVNAKLQLASGGRCLGINDLKAATRQ